MLVILNETKIYVITSLSPTWKYIARIHLLLFLLLLIYFAADTDVFKTSSGRLKKVTTSYDQTRRRHDILQKRLIYDVFKTFESRRLEDVRFMTSWKRLIYVVLKTADLRRLEEVWFTSSWRHLIYVVLKTSVKRRLCSNVVATSIQLRKKWFFVIIFRKFWKVLFRLVFRYETL